MENKLKAFTLFELVLGMLLATIVIGMAYYGSFIFVRIYDSYSKRNAEQSDIVLFKKVLSKDVAEAAELDIVEQELQLKNRDGELMLSYELSKDYVLRKAQVTDTFKLDAVFVRGSFERMRVPSGLVDGLVFSFIESNEPVSFLVPKYYSAEDLFNLKK